MRHFVILENNRYEGRRWDTPAGTQGGDWIEVEIEPSNTRDTWNGSGWTPYVEQPSYPTETVLKSPNGTPFKITVDDEGQVFSQPVEE